MSLHLAKTNNKCSVIGRSLENGIKPVHVVDTTSSGYRATATLQSKCFLRLSQLRLLLLLVFVQLRIAAKILGGRRLDARELHLQAL